MEPWAAAKKVLSQCGGATSSCPGSWPKVTCPECRVVANDKGDNEMIPRGLCADLLAFVSWLRKTPENPQLETI